MQTPRPENHNSLTFLYHYGIYLVARLLADLEVKPIAAWIEKAQALLLAAWNATQAACAGQTMARAALDGAGFLLMREVRAFELILLAAVKKNRESEEYRLFFPGGLLALERTSLDLRLRAVEAIVRHLAAGAGPAEAAAWAVRLGALHKETAAALDAYRRAVDAHTDARAAERRARDGWIGTCRSTYGELIRRFPRDRARVESYFRKDEPRTNPEPETKPAAPAAATPTEHVA